MAGVFGSPNGTSMALSDLGTQAQTALIGTQNLGLQQDMQFKQEQHKMQMQEYQMKMKQMEAFQKLAAGDLAGTPTDQVAFLDKAAILAFQVGNVDEGAKIMGEAQRIRTEKMTAIHSQFLMEKEKAVGQEQKLERLDGQLSAVTTAEQWDAVKFQYLDGLRQEGRQPNAEEQQIIQLPFSEENVRRIREGTKGGRETLQAQMNEKAKQLQEENLKSVEENRKSLEAARVARLEAAKETKAAKNQDKQGKPVGAPGPKETKSMALAIKGQFPDIDLNELPVAANDLAAEAMALQKSNPAMTWDMAMNRVINDNRSHFEAPQQAQGLQKLWNMFGEKQETHYKGHGASGSFAPEGSGNPAPPKATNSTPLPVPKDGSYVDGAKYVLPNGKVRTWNASKNKFVSQ